MEYKKALISFVLTKYTTDKKPQVCQKPSIA